MASKFIIGIDLGATNLKLALLDLEYKIKYKKILKTQSLPKKEMLIKKLIDSIQDLVDRRGKKNILGIGLGVPGPLDFKCGSVHFFPNIPGFKEVKLKEILERKLQLPVFIDNDANLMTLAEHRIGAAKNSKNAIGLTLGTGVGGGLIIDRQLYRGSAFAAGEIGHLPINEDGPQCNCGGEACLESYIGNKVILKRAKAEFNRDITLEELSTLAKKGNKKALRLWLALAKKLGIALVGLVNVLNPDCIVIGGGIANVGRILFEQVRMTIKQRAMYVQAKTVKILKARLGNDAGLIGAAILLREGLKIR